MKAIIGMVLIVVLIVYGYAHGGADPAILWQPYEVLVILGCGMCAFVVGTSLPTMKLLGKTLGAAFIGGAKKKEYLELISVMYELLIKMKKEGIKGIEAEIEDPAAGAVFSKYPKLMKDKATVTFIVDYFRMLTAGKLDSHELEHLIDTEIKTNSKENNQALFALMKLGDGLPAFGIVAAVTGVVQVMSSVGQVSNAELGLMIGRALVGTFVGILLAYGFAAPLSSMVESKFAEGIKKQECVKTILLASLHGYSALVAVEFGRKVLFNSVRPKFDELESLMKESSGTSNNVVAMKK
jgi:chemotaxis protein MotA